jgi:hypothetical protein
VHHVKLSTRVFFFSFLTNYTLTSTHNLPPQEANKGKGKVPEDYLPPRQDPPDPGREAAPPDTCPPDRVPLLYEKWLYF